MSVLSSSLPWISAEKLLYFPLPVPFLSWRVRHHIVCFLLQSAKTILSTNTWSFVPLLSLSLLYPFCSSGKVSFSTEQIDSMLPCVCSVIDHRWRQNVVRTKKWHTRERRSRVCHWCSYHVLTSSVIHYWMRRTATWNLFVYIITKSLFYFKIFQHNAKAGLLPRLCPAFARKKAIWLWKCWKIQVSFCHRSSPVSRKAWTLSWKLQELKKYPRKTCGYGQPRGHLIRVLNERSVNDGGDFCLLWVAIPKSAWYRVGDTF